VRFVYQYDPLAATGHATGQELFDSANLLCHDMLVFTTINEQYVLDSFLWLSLAGYTTCEPQRHTILTNASLPLQYDRMGLTAHQATELFDSLGM